MYQECLALPSLVGDIGGRTSEQPPSFQLEGHVYNVYRSGKQFIRKIVIINARINLQLSDEETHQHPYITKTKILRLID